MPGNISQNIFLFVCQFHGWLVKYKEIQAKGRGQGGSILQQAKSVLMKS